MRKHVWRVSYFFIKRLTKIETSSIFLNSHQKILENSRKFRFQIFTQKIPELEFSLYETIFSKLNHHYYNLSLYISIYTTLLSSKMVIKLVQVGLCMSRVNFNWNQGGDNCQISSKTLIFLLILSEITRSQLNLSRDHNIFAKSRQNLG